MNPLTPYEETQLAEIRKWETLEPSVLAKATEFVTKPISWLVSSIIPNKAIEGALTVCNKTGALLADKGDILRDACVSQISELKTKDMSISDRLANEVHNWAIGLAGAEGAATGLLGAPGLVADIPALITLAYRTIHKIGLCYGIECTSLDEKMIVNHIMSAASANTVKEKAISILTLQQIYVMIAKRTWKKIAAKAIENKVSKEALIIFVKSFSKSLGKNLTRRKALQAIPAVGGLIGASMNAGYINDVAWAARRSFQKLWLIENQKLESPNNL